MRKNQNLVKFIAIVFFGIVMSFLPAPEGLTQDAWIFFSLFVSVFIALILEPFPSAYIVLLGVAIASLLKLGPPLDPSGVVTSSKAIAWGLSGFSNTTVWLIIIAFMFALGYEKTGLGKRIALALVSKMGKSTLGLGYAIAMADLILAPFMPSNTARSGGTIFPIVKNIPILYGSTPENEPRKIGAYISWVALASTCVASSMFYTALATNVLAKSLVEDLGIVAPTWGQWFFYFLPVGIILILSVPLITYFVYPPGIKISTHIPEWARKELKEMGKISRNEIIMTILAGLALTLWILGTYLGVHATVSALVVLSLMVLFKIISWEDILNNKAAWNIFIWFGAMVTLAGGLNNVGFLDWFAIKITAAISSYPPSLILVLMLLIFYFIHYLFASSTAHVTALLALFLVAGRSIPGIDFPLLTYLLLYSLGLMGILTPYATGASPIWYGLGYIESKTFWKLGAVFGIIFIAVLILVGIPWIKLWI
ncbi:MAG: DASS family sodium-coupled anion symporter [Bacteroidales bacterium]|nr:DASS family sodium-coupled anion symporter [Bacteroidales bacterium]